MSQFYAWDGEPQSFWDAIDKLRRNEDIESDHAIVCEVLAVARAASDYEELLQRARLLLLGHPDKTHATWERAAWALADEILGQQRCPLCANTKLAVITNMLSAYTLELDEADETGHSHQSNKSIRGWLEKIKGVL